MWRYRDDGDLASVGSVAPEHAVGPRVVLGVGLKDLPLLVVGIAQRAVLVGRKARMLRVANQVLDALVNLLEQPLVLGRPRLL